MSEGKVRIEEKILNEVRQMFDGLTSDVTLHMFTSKNHCLLCNETIIMGGTDKESDLRPEIVEEIENIDHPVHLQVFVTPTCPYCPRAVLNAFKFANLNENITADMIEATEFQELSMQYQIQGVPKTIINDDWIEEEDDGEILRYPKWSVVGAVPESALLEKIKEALG